MRKKDKSSKSLNYLYRKRFWLRHDSDRPNTLTIYPRYDQMRNNIFSVSYLDAVTISMNKKKDGS